MPTNNTNNDTNTASASLTTFAKRYGSHLVGFAGALGMLVAAYFLPANRTYLVTQAGLLALATAWMSTGKEKVARRALGMLGAGIALLAAYIMPDQASALVTTAGLVAMLSLWLF